MIMNNTSQQQQPQEFIALLQRGDVRGLNFFYDRFYGFLYRRTLRATQDDAVADSLSQEVLLRLWLFREQVDTVEGISSFLKVQLRSAIRNFFENTENRFHRSFLRLDGIADAQDILLGYEMDDSQAVESADLDREEAEKEQHLQELQLLLPNLDGQQQLFIKLCIQYSFNYERIALSLGGISAREVARQVEKTIDRLRSITNGAQKIAQAPALAKLLATDDLDAVQQQIFQMRYERQWSFEQISEALTMELTMVKKLFVQAHARLKAAGKKKVNT